MIVTNFLESWILLLSFQVVVNLKNSYRQFETEKIGIIRFQITFQTSQIIFQKFEVSQFLQQ